MNNDKQSRQLDQVAEVMAARIIQQGVAAPVAAVPAEPSGDITQEDIMGAVARGWCAPENESKMMDSDLAIAISHEVYKILAALATPPIPAPVEAHNMPARRFVNVTGFLDADYVEFAEGSEFGGGVANGVPHESKHYTRADAEAIVRNGAWREVGLPCEAITAKGGNTSAESSERATKAAEGSIGDDPKFRKLVESVAGESVANLEHRVDELDAWKPFVAHIDTLLAARKDVPAKLTPVDAYDANDGVDGTHPSYGRGVFFTLNCMKTLFEAPDAPTTQPGERK